MLDSFGDVRRCHRVPRLSGEFPGKPGVIERIGDVRKGYRVVERRKDSALALYEVADEYEIVTLLTTVTSE